MVGKIGDMVPPSIGPGTAGGGKTAGIGQDFASFVRDAADQAKQVMETGERMSMEGVAGTADLNDVVAAVGDAEMTLQTVTAIRDRLIQAYQEISRMPI